MELNSKLAVDKDRKPFEASKLNVANSQSKSISGHAEDKL